MALLEMRDVHKRYGGVRALSGASFSAERGEVHALLGPNGSGKSTLNKILTGVVEPDAADIRLSGEPITIASPRDAQRHRISAVYQELSLVPDLTVAANISLATEPPKALGFLDRGRVRRRAAEVMEDFRDAFGPRLPVDEPLGNLSPGEQQIVEICKALVRDPEILVLDEATASLHRAQVDALFAVVKRLRERGVLVIFTSHRMDEIFEICDRATVLRNGQTVGSVDLPEASEAELVSMMVGEVKGAAPGEVQHHQASAEEVVQNPVALSVRDVTTPKLREVSFDLHEGEVLGLGGLQGQGQSELLAALFGAERILSGEVVLGGKSLRLRRPIQAVRAGFAFIPGNRARQGLFVPRPILENLTIPSMPTRAWLRTALRHRSEERAAADTVERLSIKIGSLADPVATLSGGNQQKVVVGKWLLTTPRVVLMDDPTKGIDVSAKAELYALIAELSDQGVAVILNSSDDVELLELSDRVLVLYEGRVTAILEGDDLTHDRLVAAALQVDETSGAVAE